MRPRRFPTRLFGDLRGKSVADLCAAPGGKTAQLVQAGADGHRGRSLAVAQQAPAGEPHIGSTLAAQIVVADAAEWTHDPFDAVLLDAPCTATGTIRRHPDIAWLKQEQDIATLTALQDRLLRQAVALLKSGGTLIYCTCSLEPEEGELAVERLLGERISAAPRADRRVRKSPGEPN